ncbi:hypothetical protein NEMIN01_1572, partial [Nematocida minor]|uniref:uncharacterized protein n=1 Tax=Nematocida minor TaxID=1912983 RepID=UPI00221EADCA
VDKTYETLYGLSLFVFLSIFSFCEINLLERIKAYYSEKDMDWKKLKYEEFRADAPNDLSKYFASKKLLPVLEEYIDELVNDGALEEIETHGDEGVHKEEKYRIVKKTEDNYKDKQHSKDLLLEAKDSSFITEHFLSKEERTVLCEKMCDEYKERIGSGMSHGAMRHTRTGAAVNVIIGTGYSKIVKNELIRMFIKSIRPKKVYVLNKEIVRVETNGENNYDILCNREYTVNGRLFSCDDVLECIRHIKDTLIRDGTVLLSLLEHDYFLCEFVVLSMSALKILSLSKSSIKNNIILNMKVTEEYKRAISHAKSLSKTTAALSSVEKDKTAKKKEKKAQRSYLQTFSIQGIEDIPISDDAAYYSTISLYIYLLHHGSGQLQHISRKNFLTVAEIEDIASRHPSLFTIHYTQPHDHSAITLTVL